METYRNEHINGILFMHECFNFRLKFMPLRLLILEARPQDCEGVVYGRHCHGTDLAWTKMWSGPAWTGLKVEDGMFSTAANGGERRSPARKKQGRGTPVATLSRDTR